MDGGALELVVQRLPGLAEADSGLRCMMRVLIGCDGDGCDCVCTRAGGGSVADRVEHAQEMTNYYYDLATDFYEYGW